jgi:hypothetical protein
VDRLSVHSTMIEFQETNSRQWKLFTTTVSLKKCSHVSFSGEHGQGHPAAGPSIGLLDCDCQWLHPSIPSSPHTCTHTLHVYFPIESSKEGTSWSQIKYTIIVSYIYFSMRPNICTINWYRCPKKNLSYGLDKIICLVNFLPSLAAWHTKNAWH